MLNRAHLKLRGLSSKQPQHLKQNIVDKLRTGIGNWGDIKEELSRIQPKAETVKIRYKEYKVKDIINHALDCDFEYIRILSTLLSFGYGVEKEKNLGKEILLLLSQNGHDEAEYDLYMVLYEEGDYKEANKVVFELAKKEHMPAMVRLGTHYYNGIGTIINKDKALEIWKSASELGSVVGGMAFAKTKLKTESIPKIIYFMLNLIYMKITDQYIYYKDSNDDRIW